MGHKHEDRVYYHQLSILNRTVLILGAITLLVVITSYYLFSYGLKRYSHYANEQRKNGLIEKVNIAMDVLAPLREQYKKGVISKDEAIEQARLQVRKLTFTDEYGKNYIFMNTMKGVVLSRPFRPQEELKDLWNSKDSKGNYIMHNVVHALEKRPNGAFTAYQFPNPKTQIEEEKLSYSILIPEWNLFVGTGAYMSMATKHQLALLKYGVNTALLLLIILIIPATLTLYYLLRRNKQLIQEIVEKKQLSTELQKNEENLRITLNSIGDAVFATDNHGRIQQMNPVAEKLTNWDLSDALGRPITDILQLFSCETDEPLPNLANTVLNLGSNFTLKSNTYLLSQNGNKYMVADSAAPIRNHHNEINGVVIVLRDVTEENILKKEAQQMDEVFRSIFEASPFVITINSLVDGRYIMVNDAFIQSTGYSREEAVGKTQYELNLQDVDGQSKEIAKLIKTNTPINNRTIKIKVKNHTEINTLFSSRNILFGDEKCVLTISTDITETRKLQEQLNHARKLDAIGQLAGGVAHDFNNMLSGILSAAELMKISGIDKATQDNYLNLIMEAAQRAADLTQKLLSFARKGKIESTPINVHSAIKDATELLLRTIDKKITIQTELFAKESYVSGDRTQLMNVFLNLGINAAHAMPDGGTLKFTSRIVNLDDNFCQNSPFELNSGDFILVEVQDTGCGIPAENMSKIFDPFFTTKEQGKGTGLGLASVYGSVHEHHGMVSVYSEVNVGTVFHVYLPLSETQENLDYAKAKIINGTGTILIVDDEQILRITAKAILENLGYDVLLAKNGKEGVAVYLDHKDDIDLVLLDMIMPEMNGKECFYEIKKINPNALVIFSSGFTKENDVKEMKVQGLAGFIRKPFHTADLSNIIAEVLNKKG